MPQERGFRDYLNEIKGYFPNKVDPLSGFVNQITPNPIKTGDVLFGSDPGEEPRKILQDFGQTGGLGGQNQQDLLNSILGSQPAQATMDTSQRLARAGLSGSGKAEQSFQDINLKKADDLRSARLALLEARLRALGIGASAQPQQGLVQSLAPIGAAAALG